MVRPAQSPLVRIVASSSTKAISILLSSSSAIPSAGAAVGRLQDVLVAPPSASPLRRFTSCPAALASNASSSADEWKLGADAVAPTRRCWPNAADFRYPKEHVMEEEMTSLVEGVLNGKLLETELMKVISLWTVYQRGPYRPYNSRIFSCVVAAYSRLGVHMLALRTFTSFPQVRWEPRFVYRAVAASAEIMGSVQPMMALLRLMERSGYSIGAAELDSLAVTCIRAGDFARARGVLQRIETSFPSHILKPRVMMEVLRSALGVEDYEKASRTVAAIVGTFPIEKVLPAMHAAADKAIAEAVLLPARGSGSGSAGKESSNNNNVVSLPALYTDAVNGQLKGYVDLLSFALSKSIEHAQDANASFVVFRSMMACGITPYALECMAALQLAAKAGHGALAEVSLACLLARWGSNARPTAECYALLCRAYVNGGDLTGALRVLQLAHHYYPDAEGGDGVQTVLAASSPSLRQELVALASSTAGDVFLVSKSVNDLMALAEASSSSFDSQSNADQTAADTIDQHNDSAAAAVTPAAAGEAASAPAAQEELNQSSDDADWEWRRTASSSSGEKKGASSQPSSSKPKHHNADPAVAAASRFQQKEAQSLLLGGGGERSGINSSPLASAAATPPFVPPSLSFVFPDRRKHSLVLSLMPSPSPSASPSASPLPPQPLSYLLYCLLTAAEEAAALGPDWHVQLLKHWEGVAEALRRGARGGAGAGDGINSPQESGGGGDASSYTPSRNLDLLIRQKAAASAMAGTRAGADAAIIASTPEEVLRGLSPASLVGCQIHDNDSNVDLARWKELDDTALRGLLYPAAAAAATAAAAPASSSSSLSSSSSSSLSHHHHNVSLDFAALSMSELLTEVRARAGLTARVITQDPLRLVPNYDQKARVGANCGGLGAASSSELLQRLEAASLSLANSSGNGSGSGSGSVRRWSDEEDYSSSNSNSNSSSSNSRAPWDRALMQVGLYTDALSPEEISMQKQAAAAADAAAGQAGMGGSVASKTVVLEPGLPLARFGSSSSSSFGLFGGGAEEQGDEEEGELVLLLDPSLASSASSPSSSSAATTTMAAAAPTASAAPKTFTFSPSRGTGSAGSPASAETSSSLPSSSASDVKNSSGDSGQKKILARVRPSTVSTTPRRALPYTSAIASPLMGVFLEAIVEAREGRKLPDILLAFGRHLGFQPSSSPDNYAALSAQYIDAPFVDLDSSTQIFNAMKEQQQNSSSSSSSSNLSGRVYDQLITALARSGRVDRAVGVFNQALEQCLNLKADEQGKEDRRQLQNRAFQLFPSTEAIRTLVQCLVLRATKELPEYDRESSMPLPSSGRGGETAQDGDISDEEEDQDQDQHQQEHRGYTRGNSPSAVLNRARNPAHLDKALVQQAKRDIEAVLSAVATHLLQFHHHAAASGSAGGSGVGGSPLALDPRTPAGESTSEWRAGFEGDVGPAAPSSSSSSSSYQDLDLPPIEPSAVPGGAGNAQLQGPLVSRYREWRSLCQSLSEYAARRLGTEINGYAPDSAARRVLGSGIGVPRGLSASTGSTAAATASLAASTASSSPGSNAPGAAKLVSLR